MPNIIFHKTYPRSAQFLDAAVKPSGGIMKYLNILASVLFVITTGFSVTNNLFAEEFNIGEFGHYNDIDRFTDEVEPFTECLDGISSFDDRSRDDVTFYLSANNYASFNHLESGGYNTNAFAPNIGTDSNISYDFGLALGTRIPFCCKALRIEVEGAFRDLGGLLTDSMQPEGPSTLYQVDYDDRWSVMTNFWLDIPIRETKTIYFGGGIGANGGRFSVNDGFVSGRGRYSEFAWQIGGGITWEQNDRWTIDIGYRYIDYGSAAVSLNNNFNNNPAGNYIADLTAHQIVLGFRYNSLGNLFAQR